MVKILVAEDEKDIRELITLTLQFSGFEVVSARDGQEAVEAAETDQFDVIILDHNMPRLSGVEACRTLRGMDKTRETPILFLSGKGHEESVEIGRSVGATDFVSKPFAPDVLVSKLNEILQG